MPRSPEDLIDDYIDGKAVELPSELKPLADVVDELREAVRGL